MQIKYGVFNPDTGVYTYKDTYEEACAELATVGYAFYVNHSNGTPCAYIEVQDDGSETWRNSEGVRVPSPEDIKRQQQKIIQELTRTYNDLPKVVL